MDQASRMALALMNILDYLGLLRDNAPTIYTDSYDAYLSIHWNGYTPGNRWINVKYDFVKDYVAKRSIKVEEINGGDNPADGFTKTLTIEKFKVFRERLYLIDVKPH